MATPPPVTMTTLVSALGPAPASSVSSSSAASPAAPASSSSTSGAMASAPSMALPATILAVPVMVSWVGLAVSSRVAVRAFRDVLLAVVGLGAGLLVDGLGCELVDVAWLLDHPSLHERLQCGRQDLLAGWVQSLLVIGLEVLADVGQAGPVLLLQMQHGVAQQVARGVGCRHGAAQLRGGARLRRELECFHDEMRNAAWMDARGGAKMHPASSKEEQPVCARLIYSALHTREPLSPLSNAQEWKWQEMKKSTRALSTANWRDAVMWIVMCRFPSSSKGVSVHKWTIVHHLGFDWCLINARLGNSHWTFRVGD